VYHEYGSSSQYKYGREDPEIHSADMEEKSDRFHQLYADRRGGSQYTTDTGEREEHNCVYHGNRQMLP